MDNNSDTILDLFDFIDEWVKKLSIVLGATMTLTVMLQIMCRYILKDPPVWTEELSRYLMIWMAFIGSSSIMKGWENVYVDYFINKFPKWVANVIKMAIKIVIFAFLIYIFYMCLKVFPNVGLKQVTPAMGIKMIWPELGIIIGVFLMLIQLAGVILKEIYMKEGSR